MKRKTHTVVVTEKLFQISNEPIRRIYSHFTPWMNSVSYSFKEDRDRRVNIWYWGKSFFGKRNVNAPTTLRIPCHVSS